MIFGNKRKLNRLKELNIQIGTEKIKRTEIYKYLGAYFDSHFIWKQLVQRTCAKAGVKLRKIERALPHLTSHTKKLLTNSLVMPYANYCSEVWPSASKTCMKRLARQFKRAQELRGKNCNQCENSVLDSIQKNMAIMTFKSLSDLTPVYLKQCFQCSTDANGYNTRSAKSKKLYVSQSRSTWQIRRIKARTIKIWNALAASTTKLNSLLLFKKAL